MNSSCATINPVRCSTCCSAALVWAALEEGRASFRRFRVRLDFVSREMTITDPVHEGKEK